MPFIGDESIRNIRETFQAIDTDGSGLIETKELKEAF
jgi:Ca2+-binding EF-hand superfamily protein